MIVEKQTAELAKIKGFDKYCSHYWSNLLITSDSLIKNSHKFMLNRGYSSAPTQSELQTWLRDVHNCIVIVDYHSRIESNDFTPNGFKSKSDIKFKVEIDYYGTNFEIEQGGETDYLNYDFDSYEDALEDGLVKALMMLPIPFTSNEGIIGEFIEVDSQTNFCGNYKHLGKKGCFMDVSEENLRIVLSGTDDFAYDKEFDSVEELREEVNRLRRIQPINEESDILPYYCRL